MSLVTNLEALLAAGQDNPMLRYGLASAYLQQGDPERALEHLEQALRYQPDYSAAWKLYGKVLTDLGRASDAILAYEDGIAVAEQRGDMQAVKEMRVFLRRLRREAGLEP